MSPGTAAPACCFESAHCARVSFGVVFKPRGAGPDTEPLAEEAVVALSRAFGVKIALARDVEVHGGTVCQIQPVHAGMLTGAASPWDPNQEACIVLAQNIVHYWSLYAKSP